MRTLMISLLFALVLSPAFAADEEEAHGLGFWVETRTGAKQPSEAVMYFDKYLTESIGFYAQIVKDSDGYASAYAGPKFKLGEGIEMGVGIGREVLERHAPSTIVKNVWILVDQERYALYGTIEHGASGTWHKATAMYKLTASVNVGVMNETSTGTGPRVEWNFAKNAQAWFAILGGKPAIAVNYAF
jgi:hypothetical protein